MNKLGTPRRRSKAAPRLENWSIADLDADPYTPPEMRPKVAQGIVTGHPKIEDGEHVVTSCIVEHDYPNRRIVTQSRTYQLGKIDPAYVAYMREHNITPRSFKVEDFQ